MFEKLNNAIGMSKTSPAELAINVALIVSGVLTVGAFVAALLPLYGVWLALLGALLAVALYELPAFAWNRTLFHDATGNIQRGIALGGALLGLLLSALSSAWFALAVFKVAMTSEAHTTAEWFMPVSIAASILIHGALKLAYTANDDDAQVRDAEREFERAKKLSALRMKIDKAEHETQLARELQGARLTKARQAALELEAQTGATVGRAVGEQQLAQTDKAIGFDDVLVLPTHANGTQRRARVEAAPKG